MRCKALSVIERCGMLRQGEVLLGLSGGADSVSLLHLLCGLQAEYGFRLKAAHVHHGLRGAEADRDEAFVRQVCEAMNVPLFVLHADVAAQAAETGEGLEACGRRIRYAFFRSLTNGEIATAHTADDNAETVLLHLTRGSGLSGLCGIAPALDGLIRPLIECTRGDVEAYCRENGLRYITDSSNLTDDYARNRIRHHAVPALAALNPSFRSAMTRCGALLRQEDDFMNRQTDLLLRDAKTRFGYDRTKLLSAHPALRDRALRRMLTAHMGYVPEYKHILLCRACLSDGGKAQISGNVTVCVYGNTLYFDRPVRSAWNSPVEKDTAVLPFGTAKIQILLAENIQNFNKQDLTNCLCCDTIYGALSFRSRLSGDAMTRANSDCRKSVKKLLAEHDVPAPFRADVPILTDGERILWAEGIGCDKAFQITENSKRIMYIQIEREDQDERRY